MHEYGAPGEIAASNPFSWERGTPPAEEISPVSPSRVIDRDGLRHIPKIPLSQNAIGEPQDFPADKDLEKDFKLVAGISGPHFLERYLRQEQREQRLQRAGKETEYGFVIGEYSTPDLGMLREHKQERHVQNSDGEDILLKGREVFLRDLAEKLLKEKNGSSPVVFLDIGGGIGKTWLKLAKSFKGKVESGDIAFVASNLIATPEDLYIQAGGERKEFSLLHETRHLVHFINSPFSKLGEQSIALPNGQKIALSGNVDMAHEDLSMTVWSKVPELDIMKVGKILSAQGVYMIGRDNLKPESLQHYPVKGEKQDRYEGIQNAHHAIVNRLGLTRVDTVEEGQFAGEELKVVIFKGPQAPLITVEHADKFL